MHGSDDGPIADRPSRPAGERTGRIAGEHEKLVTLEVPEPVPPVSASQREAAATPASPRREAPAALRQAPAPTLAPAPTPSVIGWLLDGPGWLWLAPALDALALGVSLALALAWTGADRDLAAVLPLLAFPLVGAAALHAARDRERRVDPGILDDAWPLFARVSLAGMLTLALQQVGDGMAVSRTVVVAWATALVLLGAIHVLVRFARRVVRLRGRSSRRTLIVGAGWVGARIARRLAEHPDYGLHPVGFLDWTPPPAELVGGRPAPVLGQPSDLSSVIRRTRAQLVVLAFARQPDRSLLPVVRTCEALNVDVSLVPRLFESTNDRMTYEPVGGVPLLSLHSTHPRGRRVRVKHGLDRLVAAALLLAATPLLVLIALALAATRCPVLFRQRRVGRDGEEFELLKFTTMRPDRAGALAEPIDGFDRAPGGIGAVDRRTRLGRLLRRSSLDELPQLINVLRGEMSLVGPRPERPTFVALFGQAIDGYHDRHRVRPGITGAAQVKGLRGQTSLAERVELDNFYIEHWSFALDTKILMRTLVAAFRVPE